MKATIKIEELFMLLLGMYLFTHLSYSWWWFAGLFLLPDMGMIGYAFGTRKGAITYNILHHKGLGILLYFVGLYFESRGWQLAGLIIFCHSCFDRMLGYGLKYPDSFKNTHLGKIGRE
ncbi:DUF4260 domain-containing protein [Robertkochia aurantiaca]|uniref:DUF4260 domain-containing protein n=1 Tax=Robertkochia aurantiaca TaxID=2873700 RepID=UPI001CCFFD10|nr:DUF4260 domain-containing protein [Robertkochia sp. 3YJGBD-33]